jgi:hypothetical protein
VTPEVVAAAEVFDPSRPRYQKAVINGRDAYILLPEVQPRPAKRTSIPSVKMHAPPKFGGKVDKDVTDVELWVRDTCKYATRSGLTVQDALETVTTGDARVQVDNMRRDPATSSLSGQEFADRFALHFRTQVVPKAERARQDLHSGKVCMVAGNKLHEYVSRFQSVILDAAPMQPSNSIHWFQAGLTTDLRAECHTDVRGERFTTLDAIIKHAFVQEEKLAYKMQAGSAHRRPDAHLNAVQGDRDYQDGRPAKRGRWNNHGGGRGIDNHNGYQGGGGGQGGQGGRGGRGGGRGGGGGGRGGGGRAGAGGFRPRTAERDDESQAMYQLARRYNKCTGCLNQLPPAGHVWANCPNNPANRGLRQ